MQISAARPPTREIAAPGIRLLKVEVLEHRWKSWTVYIEWCDDEPANIGTVCRTSIAANCPLSRSLGDQCRAILQKETVQCRVVRPFMLCDQFGRSSECILLE